ncbi:peptide hydrolase [Acrocarpospora pleiomorpha]|uniref:Acyl-peptide hydrolase n=1 Tax=Acrocarpospora pleiomorpha TaxID=90975 RepID=A0A5M3XEH6_9ACTN|nr:prolyl oligopeptidase family serine peptidase [Acrocarpospora pleiomorpha]GES17971.1 peptide hydrolase [Acrocarpospora pleiomorpha]
MAPGWHRFFDARQCLSLRRGRGLSRDLELSLDDTPTREALSVWDVRENLTRPVTGKIGDASQAVLTAGGDAVLSHHADDGSEMGHVMVTPLDGDGVRDLTPELPPYTLRGLDVARTGHRAVITAVWSAGFSLWLVADDGSEAPRRLFSSPNEAWNGLISADGALACLDTTDHNPGVRRFAATVIDAATGKSLAMLSDGPEAPVRGLRFSAVPGDPRLLLSTERTGFARPCVWNPLDGARLDVTAPGIEGDLVPLDWSDDACRVLAAHVDAGVHRLYEWDIRTGELAPLDHPPGAYFEPDIAVAHQYMWASHYGADGRVRLLRQRFDLPLTVLRLNRATGTAMPVRTPAAHPPGVPARSETVRSADGTAIQLWTCAPPGVGPAPLVLYLHGGPNMVTVDGYNPQAQAWLDLGIAYAALNYRGSVTFGRAFREEFQRSIGDRELEDVRAAVDHLVARGVADRDKVFVTGISYGGYLSLLAMGRMPGLFAGALAFVPMTDWEAAYEEMNPALQSAWRAFLGGSPAEAAGAYQRASPITYVEQVHGPVWIRHATNDTRCPPRQAYDYARALERAGGDVVLDWFHGGHETTSKDKALGDQQRMIDLVSATLRGERWSTSRVSPPPHTDPPPGSVQ